MSLFKETINSKVSSSLSLRQELMGKETRTPQEISFLNSNTSWVSLKSAIDVDKSSDLAKSNVLEGGSINNGKLRYGVGTDSKNAYSLQNTLGENNILGIRPMPGITSVTIENIGAYGSTRKATINYQCWDIKQLEIFEQLYMRPGYLALLEFGRTTYLDGKDRKLKPVEYSYDFFGKENINLLNELRELYNKSVDSGGNYDAFLGYVVNYGWQSRDDGGYDCKTEIISTGEILESLKTNYSLATDVSFQDIETGGSKFRGLIFPNFPQSRIGNNDLKLLTQDYSANILLGLIRELYLLGKYSDVNLINPAPSIKYKFPNPLNPSSSIDLFQDTYDSPEGDPGYKLQSSDNKNYYITLESFTELINDFIIPESGKKGALTKISVKDRGYLGHEGKPLNCLYNVLMTSVDPDVCIIKNEAWLNVLKNTDITVNSEPLQLIPPGNEDLKLPESNALRREIATWINVILDTRNNDYSTLLKNIYTYGEKWVKLKKDKGENKTINQFFQSLEENYQIMRGGITKDTKYNVIPVIPIAGIFSNPFISTSDNSLRSWNYFANDINLRKKLRDTFDIKQDISFYSLFRTSTQIGTTPHEELAWEGIKNAKNNINLDNQLNKQQSTVVQAEDTRQKLQKVQTSLQQISSNYKLFLDKIPNDKSFVTSNGKKNRNFGIIGNIYLNLKYLYKLADDANTKSQDPNDKSTIQLTQFIRTIIKDVQSSIGNVNNFEIHIDDRDGVGRIIDLNYVSREGTPFQFEIGNNRSIIRNLKLESKIFSDQMSMIAISAQGSAGKLGLDNDTIVSFNKGITDRMLPHKNSPSVIDERDNINNLVSSLSGLTSQFFSPYMENHWTANNGGTYSVNSSTSYKDYLRDIIVFFTNSRDFNTDNKKSMLLPTQISFTIDGIAGLVIGDLFTVDETFIPKSYREKGKKVGYSIMKVGHQIQNNDWTTNIEGIQYTPDLSPSPIKNPLDFDLVITYKPSTGEAIIRSAGDIITKVQQNINIIKISNTLKFYFGLTSEQAAGIIGNAFAESGLNPNKEAHDPNSKNPLARSGGLFQWNDSRLTALKNKYPGESWKEIDNQLVYLNSELRGSYKNTIDKIKNLKGESSAVTAESAFIWASEFERCKECVKGKETTEIKNRISFANKALDVILHPNKYKFI